MFSTQFLGMGEKHFREIQPDYHLAFESLSCELKICAANNFNRPTAEARSFCLSTSKRATFFQPLPSVGQPTMAGRFQISSPNRFAIDGRSAKSSAGYWVCPVKANHSRSPGVLQGPRSMYRDILRARGQLEMDRLFPCMIREGKISMKISVGQAEQRFILYTRPLSYSPPLSNLALFTTACPLAISRSFVNAN
jgi:hypothetical protein